MTSIRSMVSATSPIASPSRSGTETNVSTFIEALRSSYGAFGRFEKLRHMSGPALKRRGLAREDVARALFRELHDKT